MIFSHCRTVTVQAEVNRAEKGEEGKAPKISLAEREDRRDALQRKFQEHFPGVMRGSLRPGVRLEDTCYGFAFHNRVTEWPSPYLCTSEAQEEEKEASKRQKKRYDDEKDNKKKMKRPQLQSTHVWNCWRHYKEGSWPYTWQAS